MENIRHHIWDDGGDEVSILFYVQDGLHKYPYIPTLVNGNFKLMKSQSPMPDIRMHPPALIVPRVLWLLLKEKAVSSERESTEIWKALHEQGELIKKLNENLNQKK
jgi:hypothetical protein